jgi:hypothetical protein
MTQKSRLVPSGLDAWLGDRLAPSWCILGAKPMINELLYVGPRSKSGPWECKKETHFEREVGEG